jgi:parallel beta-helix repeat protein
MDTVNVVLGSNAVFKADSGSTMVIARDSAFVFGSGSQLEMAGLVNVVVGSITVPPTGTLSLLPGAMLNLQSGGSVIVEGTLSATGSTSQPIVVHARAEDSYSQVAFYLAYHSSATLEHCQISNFYCGVFIDSCAPTIQNNHFVNCYVAVSSNGWKYGPVIEDNTVDSCQIGFDVYTSSVIGVPTIQRDTIRACTYGMLLDASYRSIVNDNRLSDNHIGVLVINSGPVLHGNIIEDSDSLGVFCLSGAHPHFGDTLQDPGHNVIRNNAVCQIYAIDSDPFLGVGMEYVFGGLNSVYGTTEDMALITAELDSYVSAHSNWWGTENPNEKQFVTDGKATIDYSYPLSSDPNSGMRPFGALASIEKGGKSDDPPLMTLTPEQIQLRQAMVLRAQRKYREAVAIYANLISTKPNARESKYAVAELRNTYHEYLQWSGDTTLQATLEAYLRTQISNHPNALIRRIAKTLRAGEISMRRDFSTAIEEYQQLLQSATLDEDRRMCLFALFNVNALGLVNRTEAQSYLTQLQNQFPYDVRTDIAAIRFRGMVDESRGNGMQKSLAENNEQVQLPLEFSLSQNYPNPFNPVTIVKYALPIDTHTHLKIYDILGREVISLVDENMPAGYHQSTLDATRFSSGVYFYRMEAGSFTSVKKLVFLK